METIAMCTCTYKFNEYVCTCLLCWTMVVKESEAVIRVGLKPLNVSHLAVRVTRQRPRATWCTHLHTIMSPVLLTVFFPLHGPICLPSCNSSFFFLCIDRWLKRTKTAGHYVLTYILHLIRILPYIANLIKWISEWAGKPMEIYVCGHGEGII